MSTAGSNPSPAVPPRGPGRRASVTLRPHQEGADTHTLMDPANQSLADALRITYKVVQLAMIVLAAVYVFSGFTMIKENEQGIRVLFGRQQAAGLEPGFRFSYPAPFGELVKINVTGNETLDLYEDFWPNIPADQKNAKIDDLPKSPSLSPERDGSVLTADNNVAHVKLQVVYRRSPDQIGKYAQNVLPDAERSIVRGAVKRAVVQAVAQTTIDDLLREGAGEAGSVAAKAKETAQSILDRSQTGIRIEQLKLEEKIPPLTLRADFAKVQTAAATAASNQEKARQERDVILNGVAGEAAGVLTHMVERYELAIAKKDAAEQKQLLDSIFAVLAGSEARFDDTTIPAGLAGGEVTNILADARQYANEIINQRRRDLAMFWAKLEQYRTSPLVMVHREWADSMQAFMDRKTVQTLFAPATTNTLQLTINADPDISREIEKEIKRKQAEEAAEDRARKQREALFKIDTGLKVRAD